MHCALSCLHIHISRPLITSNRIDCFAAAAAVNLSSKKGYHREGVSGVRYTACTRHTSSGGGWYSRCPPRVLRTMHLRVPINKTITGGGIEQGGVACQGGVVSSVTCGGSGHIKASTHLREGDRKQTGTSQPLSQLATSDSDASPRLGESHTARKYTQLYSCCVGSTATHAGHPSKIRN